jgi:uncharacterized protein YabN with tetrapyrrole methylase and pyrophosphatase domain
MQIHESLRKNLLEGNYEVLQAMDEADAEKLSVDLRGIWQLQIVCPQPDRCRQRQFTIN